MWKEIPAHLILIGFATLVTLNVQPGSTLFSWHPFCMVVALTLMTEGILSFRIPNHSLRVGVHWALCGSGAFLAIFGFLAAYKHQANKKLPHFDTYHGFAGLVTICCIVIQAFGGNLVVYKTPKFIPTSWIKWGHRLSGVVVLTCAYITLFLHISPAVSAVLTYPYLIAVYKFYEANSSKMFKSIRIKSKSKKAK